MEISQIGETPGWRRERASLIRHARAHPLRTSGSRRFEPIIGDAILKFSVPEEPGKSRGRGLRGNADLIFDFAALWSIFNTACTVLCLSGAQRITRADCSSASPPPGPLAGSGSSPTIDESVPLRTPGVCHEYRSSSCARHRSGHRRRRANARRGWQGPALSISATRSSACSGHSSSRSTQRCMNS